MNIFLNIKAEDAHRLRQFLKKNPSTPSGSGIAREHLDAGIISRVVYSLEHALNELWVGKPDDLCKADLKAIQHLLRLRKGRAVMRRADPSPDYSTNVYFAFISGTIISGYWIVCQMWLHLKHSLRLTITCFELRSDLLTFWSVYSWHLGQATHEILFIIWYIEFRSHT